MVEEAAQQFEVRYITPEVSVIPADISVLVLVHPKQQMTWLNLTPDALNADDISCQ